MANLKSYYKKLVLLLFFVFNSVLVFAVPTGPTVTVTKTDLVGNILAKNYDNGDQVIYKIRVDNPDVNPLNSVMVSVPLSGLTSSLDAGGTGAVFSNLAGQFKAKSSGANEGTFNLSGDFLASNVTIPAGGFVEYYVLGVVNPGVKDNIVVTAQVKDTTGSTILSSGSETLTRVAYSYTLVKSATTTTSGFYEKGGAVTYKVTVTNTGTSSIKGMTITDIQPADITGVTTTATATGGSIIGSFSTSGDLIATGMTITAGSKIEYLMTGTVLANASADIINKATATVRSATLDSNTITLKLANYQYTLDKTSTNSKFTPNQNFTYKIIITNTSPTTAITKLKLEDTLSTLTALAVDGTTKVAFVPGTISTTASTATAGNSTGTFNTTGDLTATDITILPSSSVEFQITGKVKPDIVGDITNIAKITDRNGNVATDPYVITSETPTLNVTKTQNISTYKPGDPIVYTIGVSNTGLGIASQYVVEDTVLNILGNLANSGATSATDIISAYPFNSFTISAALDVGSTNSKSSLIDFGGTVSNQNLSDLISLYPNEKIIYTITVNTKNTSISNLTNNVNVKKGALTPITKTVTTAAQALANNSLVSITKVPTGTEYTPGDVITYTITVNNPTNNYMNNVAIKDLITQIQATQLSGSDGVAFESWDLSVLSQTGLGTAPGTTGLIGQTGDLLLTADIGPNGTIVYELRAKTKLTTVGTILDKVVSANDNVPENGTGVKMSNSILEIAKNVDSTEYIPGGTLSYTVDVDNPGDGYAIDVKVEDKLSQIMTTLIDGTTGPAYTSWVVTAKVYDIASGSPVLVTDPNDTTYPGFTGSFNGNQSSNPTFLVTNAILGPDRRIRYTIDVVVSPKAKGKIKNEVRVDNNLFSDKGSITRVSKIKIEKSGTSSYVSKDGTMIEYNVVVSNDASAGVALGIKVEDLISTIKAELLGDGSLISPFSSWTVDVPTLVGSETKSTITSQLSNLDIKDTVNISPGGSITYKIKAILKNPTQNQVVYGNIKNTVTADTLAASWTVVPKYPNLNIIKQTTSTSFGNGNEVDFKITVQNIGDGYANNATISDILNATYFENIRITGISTGVGSTTGITGTINTNLNSTVDIAPGGTVVYDILANVKADYNGSFVSNTAFVTDIQNGLTESSSTTVDRDGNAAANGLDIIKRSDTLTFTPGGTVTYFIDVKNRQGKHEDIRVEDLISSIKATYANDLTDNTIDLLNQSAFTSWTIYKGVNNPNPATIFAASGTTNLNDTITVGANSTVTYKIVGTVSDRVVSKTLTNVVSVYNSTNNIIGTSSIQHNIIPPGGGITRVVDKGRYIPGVDSLTYTITVNSTGSGYQNNININELIKSLSVDLIDGTTGNPFQDPVTGAYNFTVTAVNTGSTNGTEEDFTAGPANNTNLVGVVDVKSGEKLQYIITGPVRKDAIGTIDNNGLITEPYRYNLQSTKSVSPSRYQPGKEMIYTITINNNSTGNAKDIVVEDDLSSISVLDSTGATITPALTNITIDLVNSTATGYKASLGNPVITSGKLYATPDIPIGGKIVYKIKATVNEKAIGYMVNTSYIDTDAVSNEVGPAADNLNLTKEITKYYALDGTTVITGGYQPGGYIEYKIMAKNPGFGILNDGIFKDDLFNITTNYSDGTIGKAFDSWVITKTSSIGVATNSDISNSIVLNTSTTTGIDTTVDIAPLGEFSYVIKAKINEKAVGSIKNIVDVNRTQKNVSTSMKSSTITQTKQAYNPDGSVKNTFLPGETVVYKIKVQNTGSGTSYLQTYQDFVANITAEVAETPGSVETPIESVFESYSTTYTTSGGNVTTVGTYNDTINLDKVTIASGGWIEFVITGVLKKTIIGDFTNTSKYASDTKTKKLTKVPTTLAVSKKITKLAGKTFVVGDTYKPGDTIEYKITIENTGNSFYDDLSIVDNLNSIVTSLTGDTTGKALENIAITSSVENTLGNPVLTNIKSNSGDGTSSIVQEADLAPKDRITYIITGKIVSTAIGIVPANVATIGGTNYPSAPVNPKQPNIISSKTLISPVDKLYGPNEEITYKLTVENTGEGYGDDIKIVDLLSQIKTEIIGGNQGQAFTSWTLTSNITHGDSNYNGETILQNTLVDNQDINTEIDIAPTGKIEITIKAKTSSLAVGDIVNIAKVNNKDVPSEIISSRKANVELYKLPLIDGETTYSPNGNIGFRVVVRNISPDKIANDIKIKDIISSIKVDSISGGLVDAFQPGWTLSVFNPGNTNPDLISVSGVGATGDLNSANIDLAPNQIVVIRIQGKANDQAIGNITNSVTGTYNGDLGEKTVTLTPVIGIATIDKIVDTTNYIPKGKIHYKLVVKNTGTGYLNNISIVDDLLAIQTDFVGNPSTGAAFTGFVVTGITKNNTNTVVVQDGAYTSGYKGTADIYPGDTLTINIEATVNENAVGDIENTASVKDSTGGLLDDDKALVKPSAPTLKILKTIDKPVYITKDTIKYVITVGNVGQGWANNVLVTDKISGILTEFVGVVNLQPAFESWTIESNTVLGSAYPVVVDIPYQDSNNDLNATVDIGPMSAVEFVILAKIKANAKGKVLNNAAFKYGSDSSVDSNTVKTVPKDASVTIVKEQATVRENQTPTSNPIKYWLQDTIIYKITVTNGDGNPAEVVIEDAIKNIMVGGTQGSSLKAFLNWTIVSVTANDGSNATLISPAIGVVSTTDNPRVEIGLKNSEKVEIVIKAKVNEGDIDGLPISVIKNSAKLTQKLLDESDITEDSNEVVATPYPPFLETTKSIVSIGGVNYTGQGYEPGQSIVYEVTVHNTGRGVAKDTVIKDEIDDVSVELAGGTTGPAFSGWTISVEKDHPVKLDPDTFAPNTNISTLADIGPDQKVTFTITATIVGDAVGIISSNHVLVDGNETPSPEIKPKSPTAPNLNKEISKGEVYIQDGTIEYKITLKNPNEKQWLNDVKVIDLINSITALKADGTTAAAFKSGWTITKTDLSKGSIYTSSYPIVGVNLNDTIDVAPQDVITFIVTAQVNSDIVGDIVNTVKGSYLDGTTTKPLPDKTVTSTSEPGDVNISKTAYLPTYLPDGQIGYNIIIKNTSVTSIANDVFITDIISGVLAKQIGSSVLTPAFKPGWTISTTVVGDTVNTDVTTIPTSGDINNVKVDIGKQTEVIIEIRGFAKSTVYGDILNEVTFNYPDADEKGRDESTIKNVLPTAKLEKLVDKVEYSSGDKLTYTITIENTSQSNLPGFNITDEIGKIQTEISGSGNLQGLAFVSWKRDSLQVPSTSALISEGNIDSIGGDTYSAVVDIAPGDKIILTLSGITGSNVFGDILNEVIGKYKIVGEDETELKSDVTSKGRLGKLVITKSADKDIYIPGDSVAYTVVIQNIGDGWVRDAIVLDLFSEIQTILLEGITGPAFDLTNMTVSYQSSSTENEVTMIESAPDFKAEIDIKNGSTIEFNITVKVAENAVEKIDNTAKIVLRQEENVEVINSNTVTINPKAPVISLIKTVDTINFESLKDLTYTITLSNDGDVNVNNIAIQDIIKDIRTSDNTGSLVYPFEDGVAITQEIIPAGSAVVIPKTVGEGIIDDIVYMKPGAKIIYTVVAKVKDGIVGNIENTAVANVTPPVGPPIEISSTVVSNPINPVITVEKSAVTEFENDINIIPQELVTYTIKVIADRTVFNVHVVDDITGISVSTGEALFDPATISVLSVQENGVDIPYTGTINSSSSTIIIGRVDKEAIITLVAKVSEMTPLISGEEIKNIVTTNYDQNNDGTLDLDTSLEAFAIVIPKSPKLEIKKTSNMEEILLGEDLEYTIVIKNVGQSKATNFAVVDNVSKITGKSNTGIVIPAFTEWEITGEAGPNSYIGTLPPANTDLNITDAEIAVGESLTYKIKGKLSLDLNVKEIENVAIIKLFDGNEIDSRAITKIKKPMITIDKEVGLKETSIGKFVPYSILATNNENQTVKNIYIKDTPPSGFTFVENSLQVVQNGVNIGTIPTKYVGDSVYVGPFDLKPREQIEVVYLTKVSIGVVHGKYKNLAVAINSFGTQISNEDSAEIDVVEDPLFETTTVIGKVFHDRDGDGTQDDSRATKIKVMQYIPESDYIPNSTFTVIDGIRGPIKDQSVPLSRGIEFKDILHGRVTESDRLDKSKIEIYTGVKNIENLGDINVTTAEGTNITLTKDKKILLKHTGLKSKGMVSQNIVVKREVLKRSTNKNKVNEVEYYQKITIMNTGLQEEGLAGVRLANVEGLVIITDQYGRYHIPEVSSKKGKNYILKVDETTLPIGTIFTTENPKVQRLGSTMLKYNFGVILPRITYETTENGLKLLRVKIHPEVLFDENSDYLKPVIYKKVYRSIKGRLNKGDKLLVELNTSENTDLDRARKEKLLESLKRYLDEKNIEVQLIQTQGEGRI
ncbi:hypothetical protein [uncultured Cetobacterium sp.]|uniref:hypothetical protein n=1 Tax=uncultured Cetobacterium sp. TaxID=527638 RepID=UPI002636CD56|nr:hypothetical protein [uncultured Cetobacterium sp.]